MANLSISQKYLIAESGDVVKACLVLMNEVVQRHVNRLVSEPLDEHAGIRLMLIKSNIDGMKTLIKEFEQAVAKNNKS